MYLFCYYNGIGCNILSIKFIYYVYSEEWFLVDDKGFYYNG